MVSIPNPSAFLAPQLQKISYSRIRGVPVFGKTIALTRLAGVAVPVGGVVPLEKGGIDRVTDRRAFQGRLDGLRVSKDHPQVDLATPRPRRRVLWTVA